MQETTVTESVLDRLKLGTGVKSDAALGKCLGVGQQSVSNARVSGKVPDAWVRRAAESFGLSADWLLFGQGPMRREMANGLESPLPSLDKDTLQDIIEVVEGYLESTGKEMAPRAKAELICRLYHLAIKEEADAKQPMRIFRLLQEAVATGE